MQTKKLVTMFLCTKYIDYLTMHAVFRTSWYEPMIYMDKIVHHLVTDVDPWKLSSSLIAVSSFHYQPWCNFYPSIRTHTWPYIHDGIHNCDLRRREVSSRGMFDALSPSQDCVTERFIPHSFVLTLDHSFLILDVIPNCNLRRRAVSNWRKFVAMWVDE